LRLIDDTFYIFLDESGDLGFDFLNKKPSLYFVITLMISYNRKHIQTCVRRTLKKANKILKKHKLNELKGSTVKLKFKRYLMEQLEKDTSWSIYSVILDKKALLINTPIEKLNKHALYNVMAHRALEDINFTSYNGRIHLMVDRSKNKKEMTAFNEYIRANLQALLQPSAHLSINHDLSHEEPGLQVADLFSWGIYRKYEIADEVGIYSLNTV